MNGEGEPSECLLQPCPICARNAKLDGVPAMQCQDRNLDGAECERSLDHVERHHNYKRGLSWPQHHGVVDEYT